MKDDFLHSVLNKYIENILRTEEASKLLTTFLSAFMSSEYSNDFAFPEQFGDSAQTRLSCYIESNRPDEYGMVETLSIDLFSSGTGRVISIFADHLRSESTSQTERIVHFTESEGATSMAARVIAAIGELPESEIGASMHHFSIQHRANMNDPDKPKL